MCGELREQCGAEPAALPVVGDGRSDLGHVWLAWHLDVADDRDPLLGGGIDGDDRLMMLVVDIDEEVQLPPGKSRFGGCEAEVTRLVGQSSHGGGKAFAIASLEWAHDDDATIAER
jgi:hypothetical protein